MHTTHALTISPHYVVSFKFWCHSTQMLTCTPPALPHTKQGSYGFVRFKSHADAVRAIVGMNGQVRVQFWPRSGLLLGLLLGRLRGALWASPAVHIAHAAAAAPSPAFRIAAAQLHPPNVWSQSCRFRCPSFSTGAGRQSDEVQLGAAPQHAALWRADLPHAGRGCRPQPPRHGLRRCAA